MESNGYVRSQQPADPYEEPGLFKRETSLREDYLSDCGAVLAHQSGRQDCHEAYDGDVGFQRHWNSDQDY